MNYIIDLVIYLLIILLCRLLVGKVIPEKCKVMDSHQAPLLLAFENTYLPKESTLLLFKAGDDLRQDALTLQMIQIMDDMWKEEALDLQMTPYRCMVTGPTEGLIQVVTNSVTTADIHKKAAGIRGAFSEQCVANWLQQHNPSRIFL